MPAMNVTDQLAGLWQQLIGFMSQFVIPDWGGLVNLLPIFLAIGILGPIVTLVVLAWLNNLVRRPRTRVAFEDGVRAAQLDEAGEPIFPTGEPYCIRDALIYPSRTTRCAACGDLLAVVCPKCGLGRSAEVTTCGNCGLVLRVVARARALRPAGPPPGGAAAA